MAARVAHFAAPLVLALAGSACGDSPALDESSSSGGAAGAGAGATGSGEGGVGASGAGASGGSDSGGAVIGGSGSVGGSSGVGGAGPQLGEPIVAPAGVWTWVDFDDAFCANGVPTGLGINPGSSDLVLIYMMGGGICWDYETCYANPIAENISTGVDANQLVELQDILSQGPFDRTDTQNPFRDASLVYLPYCTGDLHVGSKVTSHGGIETHHAGYTNMGAYLHRLVPTFPNASKVLLAGSSAGGFGALLNWDRTQQMFGSVRVDMIDDAGQMLPNPYLSESLEQSFKSAWDMASNLPAGCVECQDDFSAIYDFLAKKYPGQRGAMTTYVKDHVVSSYLSLSQDEFKEGLSLLAPPFVDNANLNGFVVNDVGHILMIDGWDQTTAGGVSLRSWVTQMVTDDPGWVTVSN